MEFRIVSSVQPPAARRDRLFASVRSHAEARGIAVQWAALPDDVPAEFDGVSIVLNATHDRASLGWYLVHSYGSIAAWCLDLDGVKRMFHELREAGGRRAQAPDRLGRAVAGFRAFEELASSYSVWLLDALGHDWAVRPFTIFFRADLEAMTIFHREGRAPVWRDFLAAFSAEVESGTRPLVPFAPIAIPDFRPARFERQQVTQETGQER